MERKITLKKVILFALLITLATQWKAFKRGVADGWTDAMAATK